MIHHFIHKNFTTVYFHLHYTIVVTHFISMYYKAYNTLFFFNLNSYLLMNFFKNKKKSFNIYPHIYHFWNSCKSRFPSRIIFLQPDKFPLPLRIYSVSVCLKKKKSLLHLHSEKHFHWL